MGCVWSVCQCEVVCEQVFTTINLWQNRLRVWSNAALHHIHTRPIVFRNLMLIFFFFAFFITKKCENKSQHSNWEIHNNFVWLYVNWKIFFHSLYLIMTIWFWTMVKVIICLCQFQWFFRLLNSHGVTILIYHVSLSSLFPSYKFKEFIFFYFKKLSITFLGFFFYFKISYLLEV